MNSLMTWRKCRSPKKTKWFKHSYCLRLHEPAALAPLVRGELLAGGGEARALVCRE
jgi:hypothetical protein